MHPKEAVSLRTKDEKMFPSVLETTQVNSLTIAG